MKNFSCCSVLILSILLAASPVPLAEAAVSLTAPSALLLEPETQKILYSRSPHRRQSPASTAKIVTALVVFDALALDQWITISSRVENIEASKLYLKRGERILVRDLIRAVLMKSANDAAAALAIAVASSERAFADMMTEKARSLGANDTRFVNASGLPAEGQYSTVYDLALIMCEASRNPFIVGTLQQKDATIYTAGGKRYYFKSHNKMLWRKQKVIGKTGWTRRAKYCFVGLIEQGSKDAIVSILGSRKLWVDLASLVSRLTGKSESSSNVWSYGSRGKQVEKIQSALRQLGYFRGDLTGYFGPKTQKAVKKFQKAKGLPSDGIVGAKTTEALAPYI